MVWGAISWFHKSELIIVNSNLDSVAYLEDILEAVAVPFGLGSLGNGFIFQDDNARPHRAHIVEDFHRRHLEYTHMDWPPFSPDLNPIEHTWDMLGKLVKKVDPKPRTVEELTLELQIQWDESRFTIDHTDNRHCMASARDPIFGNQYAAKRPIWRRQYNGVGCYQLVP